MTIEEVSKSVADSSAPVSMTGETGARLASTVILTRDTSDGLQVWMLERVMTMPNYPGMTVFPGGGVDSRDFPGSNGSGNELLHGRSVASLAQQLHVDTHKAHALLFAAVRELFEETGTLLAVDEKGDLLADARPFHEQRLALESHELALTDVLRSNSLCVPADLIVPYARWVGRSERGTQFDTLTFLTRMPEGQEPDAATNEADDANWFPPALLLEGWRAGLVRFAPSTWAQLFDISQYETSEALWDAAQGADISPLIGEIASNPRYKEYFTHRPDDRIGRHFEH